MTLIGRFFNLNCFLDNSYDDDYGTDSEVDYYSNKYVDEETDPTTYFLCPIENQVISLEYLCDGFSDCLDGSDEEEDTCKGKYKNFFTKSRAKYSLCALGATYFKFRHS